MPSQTITNTPLPSAMAAIPSRDMEALNAHWEMILVNDTVIIRTIEGDSKVAGHLVSFWMDKKREVGYWLGKEFWGKEIATKALSE